MVIPVCVFYVSCFYDLVVFACKNLACTAAQFSKRGHFPLQSQLLRQTSPLPPLPLFSLPSGGGGDH